jgi:hypothetical protein
MLVVIKRLVLQGRIRFTEKARQEMEIDSLSADEVAESIINAQRIEKVVRSTSANRRSARERLYIIKSRTYDGTKIYTKGTIVREDSQDVFYILISAKHAEGR